MCVGGGGEGRGEGMSIDINRLDTKAQGELAVAAACRTRVALCLGSGREFVGMVNDRGTLLLPPDTFAA